MSIAETTNRILMIRPACFGFNPETAASNSFQKLDDRHGPQDIARLALEEFDQVEQGLRRAGVLVDVIDDTLEPRKTDAVFPNNWISFHRSGWIVTYPMMSLTRRHEVREDILDRLKQVHSVRQVWRMDQESAGEFLEGTGSMVLDRKNRLAFACRSPRTSTTLLHRFCDRLEYQPVVFDAVFSDGLPIYHTNVLMTLTPHQGILCLEAIPDQRQRNQVREALEKSGKTILPLQLAQVAKFAGNMLSIGPPGGRPLLVMSRTAAESLRAEQRLELDRECDVLTFCIPTIERYGGGSIRCMLAEN